MAKFFDNLLDSLHLNSEYDEPDNDTEDNVEEDELPKKKSALSKNNQEEILPEAQKPTVKIKTSRSSNKVVPMRHGTSRPSETMGVCVIKPIDVDNDAREITDTLLSGSAVIINLEGLNVNMAQRIIDFTAGACCAINGNLKIISSHVFIATPETVDISGDFQELLDSISNTGSFGSSVSGNISTPHPSIISTEY